MGNEPEQHKSMSRYGPSFTHKPAPAAQGGTQVYKNDTGKAIYADKDGKIVDEGDTNAAYLVVGPNGTLSAKDANRYGLSNDTKAAQEPEQPAQAPADADAKAATQAPATKDVKGPQSTKASK